MTPEMRHYWAEVEVAIKEFPWWQRPYLWLLAWQVRNR